MLDAAMISYATRSNAHLLELQRLGVEESEFVDEYRTVWKYILRTKRDHDATPSPDALLIRFPDLDLPDIESRDIPELISQLRQRTKYRQFLESLNRAADGATSFEAVDDALQQLQADLNKLAFSGKRSHLVDLFDRETAKGLVKEIHKRRSGRQSGIKTGLRRLDMTTGGLLPQQSISLIGRTGIGKSWIDLLFVARAVIDGHKVMLYPLEMTIEETAFRLYTIFSSQLMGQDRVFKNTDITHGRVSKKSIIKFLHMLEDRFAGQLMLADVGSLSDSYTVERIEAEVEVHQPDMFWVDYLTLLKAPSGSGEESHWQQIGLLSKGIKNVAMRRNVVGGASAQVNREALRANVFLPGPEHIAYGDSIGQDADKIISINRKGPYLYYALKKNRGGPEFGKTRAEFDVDRGIIQDAEEQPVEENDNEDD